MNFKTAVIVLLIDRAEENADKIFSRLNESYFEGIEKKIFLHCKKLYEEHQEIDITTLFPHSDMIDYIRLKDNEYNHYHSLIDRFIDKILFREQNILMANVFEKARAMIADNSDVNEVWEYIEEHRPKPNNDFEPKTIAELIDEYQDNEEQSYFKSKFIDFDKKVKIKESDLVIIAGRPSMGKTDFALALALNYSIQDIPVAFFSMEMRSQFILKRLKMFANNEIEKLAKLPIVIDETPIHNIPSLRSRIKRFINRYNIKIAFIDYLTLIDPPKAESRVQEVTKISRELKHIARETNLSLIVLSQLSRAVESRKEKMPNLSDLRDSGSIEQDADIVMFCYRPAYYKIKVDKDGNDLKHYLEIEVAKQRDGMTGKIKFYYNPETKIIADWEANNTIPF